MHMPIQSDTLDYATRRHTSRLGRRAVPLAEAHASALGDVLDSAVVVHGELAAPERNLRDEIQLVAHKVDTKVDTLVSKTDALEQTIDARLERMDLRQGADMQHVCRMTPP